MATNTRCRRSSNPPRVGGGVHVIHRLDVHVIHRVDARWRAAGGPPVRFLVHVGLSLRRGARCDGKENVRRDRCGGGSAALARGPVQGRWSPRVWGWTGERSASTWRRRRRPGWCRAARRCRGRSGSSWCAGWFPELVDAKARSLTYPEINAHRDRIEAMLATNTVTTVHQRLRDEHGLAAGISSFRRYVWLEFGDRPNRDDGDGVAPAGRAGRGSPDRLRVPGVVVRPGRRAGAAGVGVRDGAGLLPAHVRASGAVDGPARPGSARHVAAFEFFGGVPGPAGAGQLEDRGRSSPTCMTRRSTGPTRSWPPTTAV